jgi:hypothetical protein
MKLSIPILFGLVLLAFTTSVFGDDGYLYLYYDDSNGNDPIGTPCDSPRTPYVDGTPICIYWDSLGDGGIGGVDDVQPTTGLGYGQVNYNCFAFNGGTNGLGHGYFDTDPQFYVAMLPTHPMYYLQINSGGLCWRTPTFEVFPGSGEKTFADSEWTCAIGSCGIGNPPNAPTTCVASDDELCLTVRVTWLHDGLNVGGFNVYANDTLVATTGQASRSSMFTVLTNAVRSYTVKAYNGNGESPTSNADNGSTYLKRFVSGPDGNIVGQNLHGQQFTIRTERPTPNCYSGYKLFLLVNGVRGPLLCTDSLSLSITCTFPNDTTMNYCRLLMVDSSFLQTVIMTDTTDSIFHLGIHHDTSDVSDNHFLTPDRFELAQNFPNPFNPETDIMFSVPTTSVVRIQVYNIMGQLVRTLTNTNYTMGVHRIHWDGRSDAGQSLSAGIYIYRMEAPGYVQAKKMLLLK